MALYTNTITLKGYLGKDAENFATKQQKTFTVLSLATRSGYKSKQTKEWINHTEWHKIVVFGKAATQAKVLAKGDYVEVTGELHYSEFDSTTDGVTVTRRSAEIRASEVSQLTPPATGPEEGPEGDTDAVPE